MRTAITEAPGVSASSGAYSPDLVVGNLCFVSGQSLLDPSSGELVSGDTSDQTHQALTNLFAALAAAGFSRAQLAYVHVLLVDIDDWGAVNHVYKERMGDISPLPTRMIVGGGQLLPAGAPLEVQAIAARE